MAECGRGFTARPVRLDGEALDRGRLRTGAAAARAVEPPLGASYLPGLSLCTRPQPQGNPAALDVP